MSLARANSYGWLRRPTSPEEVFRMRDFNNLNLNNEHRNIQYEILGPSAANNTYSGAYKFALLSTMFGVTLTPVNLGQFETDLKLALQGTLDYVSLLIGLHGNDSMQLILQDLTQNITVSTPLMRVDSLDIETLFTLLLELLDSAQSMDIDDVEVTVKYAKQRRGGGYFNKAIGYDEFAKKKRCVVYIKSNNNDCFFQCLAICLQYKPKFHWKQPRREQEGEVVRVAVGKHNKGVSVALSDMHYYEDHFSVNIWVIDFISKEFIYRGSKQHEKTCYLLSADEHFHFIPQDKVGAIWEKRHFCQECMTAYHDNKHKCIATCRGCRRTAKQCEGAGKNVTLYCERCDLHCYDRACLQFHQKKKCFDQQKCLSCGWISAKKEEHKCNKYVCANCSEECDLGAEHCCFHQTLMEDDMKEVHDRYIFYDYESFLEPTGHVFAAVVVMTMEDPTPKRFDDHNMFMRWILREEHEGYTVIAHNGGRYDIHYIKKYMLENGIQSTDLVVGSSIFSCTVKQFNIRFIDSYRFISLPLRLFPKTFKLGEKAKGYFPYRFFTRANAHYKGLMPSLQWFDFDKMKSKERADALTWYAEHQFDEIDLWEMCLTYCESDVDLLRAGCIQFRDLFLKVTQHEIDPFNYTTIASVCLVIYRRFHMPTNTIAVLPIKREYMLFQREFAAYTKRPPTHLVRCFDSGCRNCYRDFQKHPETGRLMVEHRHDSQPEDYMKECEWRSLRETKVVKEFLKTAELMEPLNMRDAFFGGRTEPIKLFRHAREGEKIHYADYTSLYPSVQVGVHRPITEDGETNYLTYPIGHPVSITENFQDLSTYFGFIKCKVIPPPTLMIPLLPSRGDGKLLFDLTPKIGTWTTVEVMKAIELGYVVDEVYEVVHFPETRADLFQSYVETFLKIKQQAAGWHKLGCITEEEKLAYIEDYALHQGIQLEYKDVDSNPGLYYIAKLCLNSLWGKFGQRVVFNSVKDTFNEEQFNSIVHASDYQVLDVYFHNPQVRTLSYRRQLEFVINPRKANIAIAAFTTAYARLRLYQALEALGPERILYMDTDSIIYVEHKDNPAPLVLGPYLGDLTNELDEANEYITDFVTTAPKSYAYKTNLGNTCCKIKGFTLGHDASQILNFNTLSDMVKDHSVTKCIYPLQIDVDKSHNMKTKTWHVGSGKSFRFTFNKRKVREQDDEHEINTVPLI